MPIQSGRSLLPNGDEIRRLYKEKGWSMPNLAEKTGLNLHTIKRMVANQPKDSQSMALVAGALGVQVPQICRDYPPELGVKNRYSWDDLKTAAENVRNQIFDGERFLFDAVLTFPGPSSIFCGLVMAFLPLRLMVQIPVYTAVLINPAASTSHFSEHFAVIPTQWFKLLIPRGLTSDPEKKILVIDDAIVSGGTMKKLRKVFKAQYRAGNLKFACAVCYEGRTLRTEIQPEILGIKDPERRRTFLMPWGLNAFCFEDIFV